MKCFVTTDVLLKRWCLMFPGLGPMAIDRCLVSDRVQIGSRQGSTRRRVVRRAIGETMNRRQLVEKTKKIMCQVW